MPLRHIPDPRFHTWVTWTDAVIANNPRAARVFEASDDDEDDQGAGWRAIADWLTQIEPTTPRNDSFATWQEWAFNLMAVNQS